MKALKSGSGRFLLASLVALALVPGAACSGSPADPGTVEVMHWWKSGGEEKAIDAMFDLFMGQHPNEKIVDLGIEGSTNARAKIEQSMVGGQPPDTFQANGGWDLLAWVLYNGENAKNGKMESLDDLATSEGWLSEIPGPVLDTVSYGSDIYAVPLNIHRINTLYSNNSLLASGGITEPPSTLDELFAAAAKLQSKGITPFALGSNDPWTLPLLLFENLLVARAHADYYHEFLLGQHSAFDPQIKAAVDDFGRLLSYTNLKPWTLSWSEAVNLVATGQAAMTIMGDWARAQLLVTQPNLDNFDERPMPGTAGTFVFTTDTFGLPKGAQNRAGARELLKLFGSREGQDTFNPLKGSIPARRGANMDLYSLKAQATITDFESATLVPATAILAPPAFMDEMNTALANFSGGGDPKEPDLVGNASVVIHTLDNWHDILRPSP